MTRRLVLAAAIAAVAPMPARAGTSAIELQGRGVQVYTCGQSAGLYAWRLLEPVAELFDSGGKKVGRHFAGPSWQAVDGSLVTGDVVASSAAPVADAVPWLLLQARSHAGLGAFSGVTFIVRADTRGGAAPASGCDGRHVGGQLRVPYRATYIFLPGH